MTNIIPIHTNIAYVYSPTGPVNDLILRYLQDGWHGETILADLNKRVMRGDINAQQHWATVQQLTWVYQRMQAGMLPVAYQAGQYEEAVRWGA